MVSVVAHLGQGTMGFRPASRSDDQKLTIDKTLLVGFAGNNGKQSINIACRRNAPRFE